MKTPGQIAIDLFNSKAWAHADLEPDLSKHVPLLAEIVRQSRAEAYEDAAKIAWESSRAASERFDESQACAAILMADIAESAIRARAKEVSK